MKFTVLTFTYFMLVSSLSSQDMAYNTITHDSEIKIENSALNYNRAIRCIDCPMTSGLYESECTRSQVNSELARLIEYPELAEENTVEANCKIYFEVGATGEVGQTEIMGCDKSLFGPSINTALSKIEFDPARVNGKKVSRIMRTTVDFKLQ